MGCSMEPYGALRNPKSPVELWIIMKTKGALWSPMEDYAALWASMQRYGVLWDIKERTGALWRPMVIAGRPSQQSLKSSPE